MGLSNSLIWDLGVFVANAIDICKEELTLLYIGLNMVIQNI